jgi:hypothetical protein
MRILFLDQLYLEYRDGKVLQNIDNTAYIYIVSNLETGSTLVLSMTVKVLL